MFSWPRSTEHAVARIVQGVAAKSQMAALSKNGKMLSDLLPPPRPKVNQCDSLGELTLLTLIT